MVLMRLFKLQNGLLRLLPVSCPQRVQLMEELGGCQHYVEKNGISERVIPTNRHEVFVVLYIAVGDMREETNSPLHVASHCKDAGTLESLGES